MKTAHIYPKDLSTQAVPLPPELEPSPENAQPRRPSPFVSVVLSFWNEADVIPELISRLRLALGSLRDQQEIIGWELIFINDDSSDNSEHLIRQEMSSGDIRLLNMSRNFGVAVCVLAGFHHASGDAIIYMDADLQDPPEVIPSLVRAWRADPQLEVIHTVRTRREGESQLKMLLTKVGYWVLHGTSDGAIPVEAGDFKLLGRPVVEQICQLHETRPFIRGLVRWVGFKQGSVPYVRNARQAGETKFPILSRRVILNFLESALLSQTEAPLRLLYFLGGGATAFAALVAVSVLLYGLVQGDIPGWSLVFLLISVLGAIQLVALAIIALYIGNIFVGSRRRPPYIVKERLGFPDASPAKAPH